MCVYAVFWSCFISFLLLSNALRSLLSGSVKYHKLLPQHMKWNQLPLMYTLWYGYNTHLQTAAHNSGIFSQHTSLVVRGIVLLQGSRDVHMFSITVRNSEKVWICACLSFSLFFFLFFYNNHVCVFLFLSYSSLSSHSRPFLLQMTCT